MYSGNRCNRFYNTYCDKTNYGDFKYQYIQMPVISNDGYNKRLYIKDKFYFEFGEECVIHDIKIDNFFLSTPFLVKKPRVYLNEIFDEYMLRNSRKSNNNEVIYINLDRKIKNFSINMVYLDISDIIGSAHDDYEYNQLSLNILNNIPYNSKNIVQTKFEDLPNYKYNDKIVVIEREVYEYEDIIKKQPRIVEDLTKDETKKIYELIDNNKQEISDELYLKISNKTMNILK